MTDGHCVYEITDDEGDCHDRNKDLHDLPAPPLPFLRRRISVLNGGGAAVFSRQKPVDFNHKSDEGNEKAEEEPGVNFLKLFSTPSPT